MTRCRMEIPKPDHEWRFAAGTWERIIDFLLQGTRIDPVFVRNPAFVIWAGEVTGRRTRQSSSRVPDEES
jgi:hypothetical protein